MNCLRSPLLALVIRLAALLTLLFSQSITAAAKSLDWQSASAIPQPIQEIYPATDGQHIFVAGGIVALKNGALQLSETVYQYQADKDSWQEHSQLPGKRHHAQILPINQTLYVIGGFVPSDKGQWTNTSDFLKYHQTQGWQAMPAMPKAVSETTVAMLNGRLHLATGRSPSQQKNGQWRHNQDVNWHFVFDFDQQKWLTAKPAPTARNSTCSVVIGNAWHIIGGRTVQGGNLADHQVYLADSDSWETRVPLPQAQGALACALVDGDIYAMGGEYFDQGGGVYDEVWRYSPTKDVWHQMGTLPVPRHGHGVVALNSKLFVLGGASGVGARGTLASIDVLTISAAD